MGCVYRAVDQHGQVIDVLLSARRDAAAARRFFVRALRTRKVTAGEVVTDAAPVYPCVLEELLSSAWHHVERDENNPIEADHGQLDRRLRPTRGLRTDRTARLVIAGHAFVQNLRRGHYDITLDTPPGHKTRRRLCQTRSSHLTRGGRGFVALAKQITQRSPPRSGTRVHIGQQPTH
jgi:transposase-like protein